MPIDTWISGNFSSDDDSLDSSSLASSLSLSTSSPTLSEMTHYMPDSFDTFAQTSGAYHAGAPLVHAMDQAGFDAKGYAAGNEAQLSLSTINFNPMYDDGYSDSLGSFEPTGIHMGIPESPSIEKGHKLLQFSSPPSLNLHMLDFVSRPTLVSISAQLHGMFFLAESAFPGSQEPASSSSSSLVKDLTCYRRNLFQVTGSLNISKGVRFVMIDGKQVPIKALEATISATETVDHNSVKLICVPWKSPASGSSSQTSEDKTEKEPESIAIDLAAGQDDPHSDFVHIPMAWKRLQFRIATANNGRRKELQQHFVLHIKLIATLANNSRVEVAEIQSTSIVVRGRSPRNFQARNDLPISGSVGRRSLHVSRHSTGDARLPSSRQSKPSRLDSPKHTSVGSAFQFSMEGSLTPSPSFSEWKMPLARSATDLDQLAAQYTAGGEYPVISVATPPEDMFAFGSAQASPPVSDLDLMVPQQILRPASAPLRRPHSALNSPNGMPRSIPSRLSKSPFEDDASASMSPKKRARTGDTPPPVSVAMTTAANSIVAPLALGAPANPIPFMLEGYVDPLFAEGQFQYNVNEWNNDGMYYSSSANMPPVTHVNPEFISVTARGATSKRAFEDEYE